MTPAAGLLLLIVTFAYTGCPFERVENPGQFRDCLPADPVDPTPQSTTAAQSEDGVVAADPPPVRLQKRTEYLASDIGARSYRTPDQLARAARYIETELRQVDRGRVDLFAYRFADLSESVRRAINRRAEERHCPRDWQAHLEQTTALTFQNIELTIPGSKTEPEPEVVIVGAHYDSDACESGGCNPGADDNASGVAALIELAARVGVARPERTVRFVAFTNEEEPFFWTEGMGSWRYAHAAHQRGDRVAAMLAIETIGYYRDDAGSQDVPWYVKPFIDLPDAGNFIAFVGNRSAAALVRQSLCYFQQGVRFPAEGIAAWGWFDGIEWSDHWAFSTHGYPAVMVTDTAPSRNHCYHRSCDTPGRLDYDRMARVVFGLEHVILSLASSKPPECRLQ